MNGDLFEQPDDAPRPEGPIPDRRETAGATASTPLRPLPDRLRPRSLAEIVGQDALLASDGPLRPLLSGDLLPSLLFWGPPGCGKTTLARVLAGQVDARFLEYSAVRVGAKELKAVMAESERLRAVTGRRTVLFLDEIHRFNKAQQDALLPWVERGDITLIGATTENPSFELNSALMSRLRLFVLAPLRPDAVVVLLRRALDRPEGLASRRVWLTDAALLALAELSGGDGRQALGLLDAVTAAAAERHAGGPGATAPAAAATTGEPAVAGESAAPVATVDVDDLAALIQHRAVRYDKQGDEHFNLISALHKSLRNSDVQAALYWLARMLEGGEDPLYLARRLVRFASEDVGLADPQALPQALAARDAVHFIGLPEGALALAQATVYLALAPKSNALYTGFGAAQREVQRGENPPVPLHLCNAPTHLMQDLGYGRDYVYAPNTADGIAAMNCLPDSLATAVFYRPRGKGWERELAQRMQQIEAWHRRRAQPPPAPLSPPEPPQGGDS
ncbi:MAG: replication-associated recombination protein A [Candidatus Krumholzibacteria bacterium]|jgi:putative ATPase|nr:replication-associated recombination protein A [Candidatus Krumholzibacteria bacterium]